MPKAPVGSYVRQNVEVALNEGGTNFRLLAEMTPLSVFILQGTGFVYVNPAAVRLTGYSSAELLKSKFYSLFPVESKKIMRKWGLQVQHAETLLSVHGEFNFIAKNGEEIRIDVSAATIEYEGKPAALVTALELNEQRREEILQDVVNRIAQAADGAKTLDDLFPALHAIIAEVMVAKNFYIALFDRQEELITYPYYVDEYDQPAKQVKPEKGLTEFVLRTGKSLLCDANLHRVLEEQGEIAQVLSAWETIADLLAAQIVVCGEHKRGLMQQLLTGQTRFKEFVKSGKKVKTRYGDFPEDWSQVHMGDIADERGKKNHGGKKLPVLSCTKYRGLVNSLEYFGKRIFSEDTSTYRIVQRGDFAYATNHVEEGSIGYQNLHDAALISPMYTVFRTRAGVDQEFFFKLIKTELYRHIFEVNTSGSIARRGALRWDEFALIKVFLPGVPEQKRIAAVLNTGDREIELLQKQLEALKEQKRGLMQKLLTGKIRVK